MWGWEKYVPVAERIAKSKKKMAQLKKKGKVIEPIEIEGRKIAKKFWGKRWCEYLENFADFDNRLPRGRAYARNGSVCHLSIKEGFVEAFVAGSSLYTVKVSMSSLQKNQWRKIKNSCSGQIGSMIELLKGDFSDQVMSIVSDAKDGLFPKEEEIEFSCNCFDWADMCKHVAAVLYGIGSRLDERPDLLFLLRGVNAQELITTKLTTSTIKTDDLLEDSDLHELFGIELEDEPSAKTLSKPIDIKELTGKRLKKFRLEMKLTPKEFAKKIGVTIASIYRWEKIDGPLSLQQKSSKAVEGLFQDRSSIG